MGILNFFRKKPQEPEPEPEEIRFNEIENWLENNTKELKQKEFQIFDLIKERINLFIQQIDPKIKILEEIDVESKKAEERAKIIVKQGLDKYLEFVNTFIRELKEIETQVISQFIKDMNKIFSSFEKHSYIFYQRATFLIGDELAAVKKEINLFSGYFTKLFKENQKIIDSSNNISSTRLKLKQLDETTSIINKINLEIESLDNRILDKKEQQNKIKEDLKNIKTSKNHEENLKNKEEIKLNEKQLEEDSFKLKTLIDFKALSNAFHSEEKKMKTIKSYREDFQESLAKDNGESILDLINKAELNSNIIANQIKQINEKKLEIAERKKLIKKDETKKLSEEIEKIKSEIETRSIEKIKHVKRIETIKEQKLRINLEIKEEIEKLGGIII